MNEGYENRKPGLQTNFENAYENAGSAINNAANGVKQNMNNIASDFSNNSTVAAGTSFLEMNTIIAKFSFLVLVVVGFVVLFNLGVWMITYFTAVKQNPMLISGQTPGDHPVVIYQDPNKTGAIPIQRSNNETTGIEFTWSCWIQYNVENTETIADYQPVFVKGDCSLGTTAANEFYSLNNCPGVYFGNSSDFNKDGAPQTNSLWILMDTIPIPSESTVPLNAGDESSGSSGTQYMEITNIPINKYFHLAIRCQNKYIDVYINGTVVYRIDLINVPKQNFYDIHVGENGGFNGNLSNLQYFSKSLSVIEINDIVLKGPNTTAASVAPSNKNSDIGSSYLSNLWYNRFIY
jgi:hypothetical protein